MVETADVVIIGGGIVGASVAYHLTERGCRNVLMIEREAEQGLGSTGRATGGARAQFATTINIQMSLYSIQFLAHFEEVTGHSAGYRPNGYLLVATSERHLKYLKANRLRQMALGLKNVELVTGDDIARMIPQLRADDIVGGSFCQTDGFVKPLNIMKGFTARARERGVRLWLGTNVTGIDVDGGRVSGLTTTRGRVATRVVVNAAGAWAALVAQLAGLEIPVAPLRRQLVAVRPVDALPAQSPMVIDMSDGFHFRPDSHEGSSTGMLIGWPGPKAQPGFNAEFDSGFAEKALLRAQERVPSLVGAELDLSRSRAGLYEMTPDHHAIICEAPNIRGLFLANGFSGHGVMHSPATGRIVSELILNDAPRLFDIAPLSLERFAAGSSTFDELMLF
jgi:sarcosine oxidase subunit beta